MKVTCFTMPSAFPACSAEDVPNPAKQNQQTIMTVPEVETTTQSWPRDTASDPRRSRMV